MISTMYFHQERWVIHEGQQPGTAARGALFYLAPRDVPLPIAVAVTLPAGPYEFRTRSENADRVDAGSHMHQSGTDPDALITD